MNAPEIEIPSVIGAPFGGGFYFGREFIGDCAYAIIVAPKAEGDLDDMQWNKSRKAVEGANSYFDGLTNTEAMAAAGSKLAEKVRALRIGDYDDWYLPARQEALIIKGNEAAAGKLFQPGGTEAFERRWYWTSTQSAADPDYAWLQDFYGGGQSYGYEDGSYRARAVRRMPV